MKNTESAIASYPDVKGQLSGDPKEHYLVGLGLGTANYWFTFVSDPLTVGFLLFWEAFILGSSPAIMGLSYVAGLLTWSFLEYSFHRWVYHKGHTPAHDGHNIHHRESETLIAMPWFVVTGLFGLVWYIFTYLLQFRFVSSFAAGLLSGFIIYGAFHHIHHHFDFKSRSYRRLRAHHLIHHRFEDVNFGVTSRFWDHVFGTTYNKEVKANARQNR